ncbi:MAG: TIGR03936 family radical SAM-associated protein, partial [Deltaproteobacteria bacterium]
IGGKAAGGKVPLVNVSASCFIPKPYTPFQWEPQISLQECAGKQADLKKRLAALRLGFKWHDPRMSVLEGAFSRGDRRLSTVLVNAFKRGCRFDGWSEKFRFDLWEEAFKEAGIGMEFYTGRERSFDEVFPWDHLNPGVTKEFLYREYKNSLDLVRTPDCKVAACSKCGVCDFKTIRNVVAGEAGAIEGIEAGNLRPRAADVPPCRLRLKFSKTGVLRFLSHLELINAIVRGIKRAGLPLRYSQGFHPLPKVSFSAPLPVGIESLEEYMDMELDPSSARLEPKGILERLNAAMPEGISFLECGVIPLKLPIPSAIMTEYVISLMNGPAGLNIEPEKIEGFVRDFLGRDSIVIRIEKEGMVKEVDIRAQIAELSVVGDAALRMVLRKSPGANARPHDILSSLLGLPGTTSPLIPVLKIKTVH